MNDPGSWGDGLGPQGASEWHTAFVSVWIHLFRINLFHLGKVSSGFWLVSVLKEICKKKISRINYSLHFRGWFWGHKWYSSFFFFTIHSRFPLPSTSAGLDGLPDGLTLILFLRCFFSCHHILYQVIAAVSVYLLSQLGKKNWDHLNAKQFLPCFVYLTGTLPPPEGQC